ncbi:MAG: molecular chaperone DnaJ [Candidatus Aureabacteria bacterium]|jgi:molecular chaperone DnaJ|nr:molecular chaperone DnaJ [Candidatus Auribacterota bacterium]NLW94853.1 molecular chaperone DnaJ [Chlamydiota bacterium]HOE27147.1 molecular chaperone DnaJ [bacterium]
MTRKDLYETLGVGKSATAAEIKRAYRALAKKYHPDANPGNKAAEERFKEISQAYDVLADPAKRKQYDQMKDAAFRFDPGGGGARAGGGGHGFSYQDFGGFGDLGDLFSSYFDRGTYARRERYGPRRGEDLTFEVEIPFEEAIRGGRRTVTIPRQESCGACGGAGARPGSPVSQCPDCGGAGTVSISQGGFAFSRPCARCYGRGQLIRDPCPACGGQGVVRRHRRITVKIPPGVDNGSKIRVAGQGEPGPAGGPPGDLILVVRLGSHRFFGRKGEHIYCEVPVNFAQAALGSTIRVRTTDGAAVVKVPAGVQTGASLRLKGRGIAAAGGRRGDMFVRIKVATPRNLAPKARKALEEFAREAGLRY